MNKIGFDAFARGEDNDYAIHRRYFFNVIDHYHHVEDIRMELRDSFPSTSPSYTDIYNRLYFKFDEIRNDKQYAMPSVQR